jgi:hypothetical protein
MGVATPTAAEPANGSVLDRERTNGDRIEKTPNGSLIESTLSIEICDLKNARVLLD